MECCGKCEYHVKGEIPGEGDFVCNNAESEAYGLETAWDDVCEEFENRY